MFIVVYMQVHKEKMFVVIEKSLQKYKKCIVLNVGMLQILLLKY